MARIGEQSKFSNSNTSATATEEEESEEHGNEIEEYNGDSGNEDDADLDVSEEIILPEEEDEDSEEDVPIIEDDEEIFKRQISYPPLPEYIPPNNWISSQPSSVPINLGNDKNENLSSTASNNYTGKRNINPRERLGVLTPMEEVTEPPSSAGTEASTRVHRSRERKRARNINSSGKDKSTIKNKIKQTNRDMIDNNIEAIDQKSILKSKLPTVSPDRKVKFIGAGSITQSERSVSSPAESITSEYSSLAESGRKNENSEGNNLNENVIPEETEEEETDDGDFNEEEEVMVDNKNVNTTQVPVMEQMEKVQTWQLESHIDDALNNEDDFQPSSIDGEFASILDDIIAELHSWDRLAGTGAGITEITASRQDHFANVSSQLSSYLSQISAPTVMTNLPQLIPLITTLLNVTDVNFRAQLSSLSTTNVFSDRLRDCKSYSGLKVLPNADLTWLVRALCEISSDSSRSVLKSEGTAALAKLVRASGPEMICEPILFILMGNDEKTLKKGNKAREGSGNIVTTGVSGGAPKIKATALDTLTFALLTFPRDDFDLFVVGKLACHCLIHPKRRVRQAALECLAVAAQSLGSNVALPMFRQFILEEEKRLISINASNSSISTETSGTGSGTTVSTGSSNHVSETATESGQEGDARSPSRISPSRIPIPIKVLEANLKAQAVEAKKSQPSSPIKTKGPTPSSAISARISRHVLPTPNVDELVEYGLKIPANCQLLSRQSMKIGGQKESSGDESSNTSNHDHDVTHTVSINGREKSKHGANDRLSSSGESCSSISNIEYSLLELEPVLTRGSGGHRRTAGGVLTSSELATAPDIAWILNGTGPVKTQDPSSLLPKELNLLTSGTKSQPQHWNSFGSSSSNESDFSNKTTISNNSHRSDFTMRRINSRGDLIQDSFTNNKEANLSRFYYPTNNIMSPRGPLTSSDSVSSRYSSKSSYNLLPSKYSIGQNKNGIASLPYRGGGGDHHPDFLAHHALLPGAYENPFGATNGYINGSEHGSVNVSSSWSHGHAELGSISRISSKPPKPLHPISSLRERYFDSTIRRESQDEQQHDEAQRSDSQQSRSTEDDSESEIEKTEPPPNQRNTAASNTNSNKNINANNNANAKKPPTGRRPAMSNVNGSGGGRISRMKNDSGNSTQNKNNELSTIQRQTEVLNNGIPREYQVFHHRIELDSSAAPTTTITKRTDADSAGSNHTRDSGVSLGSHGGSKTPPSVHNTPPSVHRSPVPPTDVPSNSGHRSSSKSRQNGGSKEKAQLHRNWRSTPDVPQVLASDTDDGESQSGSSRRNRSGNSDNIVNNRSQTFNPNHQQFQTAQLTAGDENMPVHRKPVLARRGQSVGPKVAVSSVADVSSMPPLRHSTDRSRGNSVTRNGSGDHFLDVNESYVRYGTEELNSPMSMVETPKIRNSVSTGNILDVSEDRRLRLPQSKSSYFEINGDEEESLTPRTGRVSKRDGPFGDMKIAVYDDPLDTDRFNNVTTISNTPIRRIGLSKSNGKIVPTKVYKGSFREINSRKPAHGPSQNEVFPIDLKPVTSPKHALPMALEKLQSSDWETNVDGFRQMVRMIRFNPEAIRADLHNINMAGVKHLTNLRSQVCRAAILCFKELFAQMGRLMEADCEKIAEKLLDKAADTNKFIREDSGKALESMMNNVTPAKGLTCLDLFGTRHRNPAVRCMAAKLTATLVETLGPDRSLSELAERLLPMLCKLLQEGSLDTRTSAKSAMSTLMTHPSFYTMLKRCVPSEVLRHCQKNIDALQQK